MRITLSENDIKALFPPINFTPAAPAVTDKQETPIMAEKTQKKQALEDTLVVPTAITWKIYLKFTLLFAGLLVISYIVVNFSALSLKIRYYYNFKIKNQAHLIPTPNPSVSAAPAYNSTDPANLIISKIGVDAPIIWNVEESQIENRLLDGVVHFQGTALPDQIGNIFITGHSSYYSWSSSPYKAVFALLENLEPGDIINIQYQNTRLNYIVNERKVVSPDEVSVMDQTQDHRLTLMTCVPVGTNLNRLIIVATQTSSN